MSDVAIPDGWTQVKLGDVCEVVMGQSPPGDTVERFPTGKPLLNGPTEFSDRSPIPAQWTKRITKVAPQGSLLFCVRGSTTGKMNWADQEYVIGRGIGAIWHKSQGSLAPIVRAWIEYQLPHLLNIATGSTFPNVSRDQLTNLSILLPPLHEQKAIAHILGTLDDKIDQLRKTNSVLEDMASALFKSWFVDFDPVKAKQENRPTGLPKDLDDFFPDSFEDSALGPIPTGWRVGSLKQLLVESTERIGERTAPEYASTISGLHPRSQLFTKVLSADSSKNKIIRDGDMVFGMSRDKLNYGRMTDEVGSVSSAYKVFRCSQSELPTSFIYQMMLLRPAYFFQMVSSSSREGQSLSMEVFGNLSVVVPPIHVQSAMDSLTSSCKSSVHSNQIRTLTNLRDTLLPKLISGDLRVPEAEQMVAELGL